MGCKSAANKHLWIRPNGERRDGFKGEMARTCQEMIPRNVGLIVQHDANSNVTCRTANILYFISMSCVRYEGQH